jgi:hypothetical protein
VLLLSADSCLLEARLGGWIGERLIGLGTLGQGSSEVEELNLSEDFIWTS